MCKEHFILHISFNLWRLVYDSAIIILVLALTMSLGMELFLTMLLPMTMDMPFLVELTPILTIAYGNCQGTK
jgi:hypothetical protein